MHQLKGHLKVFKLKSNMSKYLFSGSFFSLQFDCSLNEVVCELLNFGELHNALNLL